MSRESRLWAEAWRVYRKCGWVPRPRTDEYLEYWQYYRRARLSMERLERQVRLHGCPFDHARHAIAAHDRRERWRKRLLRLGEWITGWAA